MKVGTAITIVGILLVAIALGGAAYYFYQRHEDASHASAAIKDPLVKLKVAIVHGGVNYSGYGNLALAARTSFEFHKADLFSEQQKTCEIAIGSAERLRDIWQSDIQNDFSESYDAMHALGVFSKKSEFEQMEKSKSECSSISYDEDRKRELCRKIDKLYTELWQQAGRDTVEKHLDACLLTL